MTILMIFTVSNLIINSDIMIAGISSISLLLSERDVKAIIELSHQISCDESSAYIMNTRIRKTWKLNVNQFELKNSSWEQALQEIINRVQTNLDAHCEVKVKLHKMLLYEMSDMFKQHIE